MDAPPVVAVGFASMTHQMCDVKVVIEDDDSRRERKQQQETEKNKKKRMGTAQVEEELHKCKKTKSQLFQKKADADEPDEEPPEFSIIALDEDEETQPDEGQGRDPDPISTASEEVEAEVGAGAGRQEGEAFLSGGAENGTNIRTAILPNHTQRLKGEKLREAYERLSNILAKTIDEKELLIRENKLLAAKLAAKDGPESSQMVGKISTSWPGTVSRNAELPKEIMMLKHILAKTLTENEVLLKLVKQNHNNNVMASKPSKDGPTPLSPLPLLPLPSIDKTSMLLPSLERQTLQGASKSKDWGYSLIQPPSQPHYQQNQVLSKLPYPQQQLECSGTFSPSSPGCMPFFLPLSRSSSSNTPSDIKNSNSLPQPTKQQPSRSARTTPKEPTEPAQSNTDCKQGLAKESMVLKESLAHIRNKQPCLTHAYELDVFKGLVTSPSIPLSQHAWPLAPGSGWEMVSQQHAQTVLASSTPYQASSSQTPTSLANMPLPLLQTHQMPQPFRQQPLPVSFPSNTSKQKNHPAWK